MIIAIIPAAGKGVRLGDKIPKQFIEIKDLPVLIRTVLKFENHPQVQGIVIAVDPHYKDVTEKLVERFKLKKVLKIVEGGETRQHSVYNGVKASPQDTQIFLVHDAVRPLVSQALITKIIEATIQHKAAIPVIPVRDTLNYVENGLVKRYLERKDLFHVQTPQGIEAKILLTCLERAEREKLTFPDESTLLTHYGYPVSVVEGSFINFKITFREDLVLAEKLIDCKIEELF